MRKINILFICKYNIFRSKVAEAYFEKINKNKNIKIKSAGLIPESKKNYKIIKTTKKLGLRLKGSSKGITTRLLKQANIIVIVANDVPEDIFKYNGIYPRKVILWKINDVYNTEKDVDIKRERVIKQIMKKIDKLNKNIEKNKIKW